jgi:hypothetical protein
MKASTWKQASARKSWTGHIYVSAITELELVQLHPHVHHHALMITVRVLYVKSLRMTSARGSQYLG